MAGKIVRFKTLNAGLSWESPDGAVLISIYATGTATIKNKNNPPESISITNCTYTIEYSAGGGLAPIVITSSDKPTIISYLA